ncbi:protein lifeguard 3-like [Genypterus blacodes]|uniref:protein lifeguard 3-like n=1 Tax=Genypterus blacodes TaxID=154954 RepID=UPI003F761A71
MPKADSPPAYEDALHHPKLGNNPPNPHPHPPPPAYSSSPAMYEGQAGYWAQDGFYSHGPARAAPGRSPSGMPTVIPTLSGGLPPSHAGEMDDLLSSPWDSTSVRHGFIRKVYLILAAQLAVTFSVVGVFTFVEPVKLFVIRYPGIYWASFAVYFLVYCILICCKKARRRVPWNFLLLGIFTLVLSYMSGTIASYYETKAVFIAIGITAVVCIAVTIFCFQTKVDFTSCGGVFCLLGVVLLVIGIVTAIVLSFKYVPWLHMVYAAIGAVIFTLFLAYNTQLIIGNRELAISPEEYVYGALSLYVDVVEIFLFILQVSGGACE